MKALSLKQPYAWLILQRAYEDNPRTVLKPIENRPRPLPKNFVLPQRVLIHASMTLYDVKLSELKDRMTETQWERVRKHIIGLYSEYAFYRSDKAKLQATRDFGCILGSVIITGQVIESQSPWFFGKFGYTLEFPEMLKEPVPYKGQLGFFEINVPYGDLLLGGKGEN